MACIFCQIINKEIPAEIVYEDKKILIFKDINPKAKIHLLVIPREHFSSLNEAPNQEILGEIIWKIKELAPKLELAKNGYKLIINTGKEAGQDVLHLHLHLLGGEDLRKKTFSV